MKKILLLSGAGVLIVALAVGATLFLTRSNEPALGAALPTEGGGAAPGVLARGNISYYNFQPEFVVNFGAKQRPRFLMVEVAASTYDEQVPDLLDDHTPLLRNELLMLFGSVDSATLMSAEGKQALLDQTLEAINTVMQPYYAGNVVEHVYFTRFVLQ